MRQKRFTYIHLYFISKEKDVKSLKIILLFFLQDEIAEMKVKIEGQQNVLHDRLPGFIELEKKFEETTKSYEDLKKEIVGELYSLMSSLLPHL